MAKAKKTKQQSIKNNVRTGNYSFSVGLLRIWHWIWLDENGERLKKDPKTDDLQAQLKKLQGK
jgi:hypothetical protein